AIAAQALESGQIVGGARASAAETLLAWCDALAGPDAEPPARSPRRDVLGPTEPPPLAPEPAAVQPASLATLARRLLAGAAPAGPSVGPTAGALRADELDAQARAEPVGPAGPETDRPRRGGHRRAAIGQQLRHAGYPDRPRARLPRRAGPRRDRADRPARLRD